MHDKMWVLTVAQYNGQRFFKLKPLCLSGACVISELFSWLWSLLLALCNSHTETHSIVKNYCQLQRKNRWEKEEGGCFPV